MLWDWLGDYLLGYLLLKQRDVEKDDSDSDKDAPSEESDSDTTADDNDDDDKRIERRFKNTFGDKKKKKRR